MPVVTLFNQNETPEAFYDVYELIRLFNIGDRGNEVHPVLLSFSYSMAAAGIVNIFVDTPLELNATPDADDGSGFKQRLTTLRSATADDTKTHAWSLGLDIFESFIIDWNGGTGEVTIEYALAEGGLKFDIGVFLPKIRQVERSIAAGEPYHQPPVYKQVGNQGL